MFVHSHHTLTVLLYDEKEKERKQYFSKIQPYSIFTQNGLSITSLNLHHHKICIKMADELFKSRIS